MMHPSGRAGTGALLMVLFLFIFFQVELLPHLIFHLLKDIGIFCQELLRVLPALTYPFTLIGIPGTAFLDDIMLGCKIEDITLLRYTFTEDDVEFRPSEGGGNLVLHYLVSIRMVE